MPFVLSVHVKNIRTGSEVAQILHSWGLPDLTSVCRGQESSASLDTYQYQRVLRAGPF